MDRKNYLNLCMETSKLKKGTSNTLEEVPYNLTVTMDGNKYYAYAYQLIFENGTPAHIAILHEIGKNAIYYTRLEKVVLLDEYKRNTKRS